MANNDTISSIILLVDTGSFWGVGVACGALLGAGGDASGVATSVGAGVTINVAVGTGDGPCVAAGVEIGGSPLAFICLNGPAIISRNASINTNPTRYFI